jgi:hypothetical protein
VRTLPFPIVADGDELADLYEREVF